MNTITVENYYLLEAELKDSREAIYYLLRELIEEAKISGSYSQEGNFQATTRIVNMIKNSPDTEHFRDLIEPYIIQILDEFN